MTAKKKTAKKKAAKKKTAKKKTAKKKAAKKKSLPTSPNSQWPEPPPPSAWEFEDQSLRDEVVDACSTLEKVFKALVFDPDGELVTRSTQLGLEHRALTDLEFPAGDLASAVAAGQGEYDGLVLWAPESTYFRVVPADDRSHGAIWRWKDASASSETHLPAAFPGDDGISCSMVAGATPVALAIVKSGNWDKHYEAVLDSEAYVVVRHPAKTPRAVIRDASIAYLFELSTSFGLQLSPEPRPVLGDWDFEDDGGAGEDSLGPRLRPLLRGAGVAEVLLVFQSALTAHAVEWKLLNFFKVFEYVAASVSRAESFSQLEIKLASPQALRPDAEYLLSLHAVVARHAQAWKNDKAAMAATVVACCSAPELAEVAPSSCKALRNITSESSLKEERTALTDFGERMSATRNALAHSKANYQSKGMECPDRELEDFAMLCEAAAAQAIRWFAASNEKSRVLAPPVA